jgi:hypothetical protein
MSSPQKQGAWGDERMLKNVPEVASLKIKLTSLDGTEPYPKMTVIHSMDECWQKYSHKSFTSQVQRIRKWLGKLKRFQMCLIILMLTILTPFLSLKIAKGAVSSDEEHVRPDPSGGVADAGAGDDKSVEDDWCEFSYDDDDDEDEDEDADDDDDDDDGGVASPPTTTSTSKPSSCLKKQSSHTSPSVPPSSAGNHKKTPAKKSAAKVWSNMGEVVFEYIATIHERISNTSRGRELLLLLELRMPSGALIQGQNPTVVLNRATNVLEITVGSQASKDWFYCSDGRVNPNHEMYSVELVAARNMAVLELTKNDTDIPSQVMKLKLPVKCSQVLKTDIPTQSYVCVGATAASTEKVARYAKMNVYMLVQFQDFEKRVETIVDDVDSPLAPNQHMGPPRPPFQANMGPPRQQNTDHAAPGGYGYQQNQQPGNTTHHMPGYTQSMGSPQPMNSPLPQNVQTHQPGYAQGQESGYGVPNTPDEDPSSSGMSYVSMGGSMNSRARRDNLMNNVANQATTHYANIFETRMHEQQTQQNNRFNDQILLMEQRNRQMESQFQRVQQQQRNQMNNQQAGHFTQVIDIDEPTDAATVTSHDL